MLRVATEADLPAIVAIHKSNMPTRLATADLDPVSVESRTGWFAEHSPERRPLWVLDGAAGIERPAYGATAEVSVYVHADHKGRGNGRLLLATGIERAPGLGLETCSGSSSATTARAFACSRVSGSGAGVSFLGSPFSTASSVTW